MWIVEPVFTWRIKIPWMGVGTMIENHVHNNLQATLMTFINQLAVFFVCSKTWINTIIVCCGIAMIAAVFSLVGRSVVFQYRCEPKGCYSQLSEIVKMLSDAFEVASMTHTWFASFNKFVAHRAESIVTRVTVSKAVGHHEIEHICICESHVLVATHGTLL